MGTRLTDKELALRWRVTTRTLANWRKAGKGPAWMDIGKNTVRYREEDIIAYEEKNLRGDKKDDGEEHF